MPPWSAAPIPPDEQERLRRLARLGVGEGQRHEVLDHVTALASRILGAPIALVTLVEKERQLFLSRHGLDAAFTGRRESFCGHCVASRATLRVEDADLDERFAGGPLVVGAPGVRAYLGIPLLGGPGQSAIGTLCAIDHVPRAWTRDEETQLVHLAAVVENYLENVSVRRAFDDSPLSTVILDRHGRCVRINPAFARMLGHPVASLLDKSFLSLLLPADRGVFAAMLSHTVEQRTSPTRRELRYLKLSGEVVHGGTRLAPFRDVDEQIICAIRDISLERRMTSQSGVVSQVRAELRGPLERARELIGELDGPLFGPLGPVLAPARAKLLASLSEFDEIIEARIGDVSARVRVEEELHASEQRLRAVMEQVLGPLLVIDDHGRVVDANASAYEELRWDYTGLVGQPLRSVMPSFTDALCRAWYDREDTRSAAGPRLPAEQVVLRRTDGIELTAEMTRMKVDWNGPGRLVLLFRDVTADRAREHDLLRERDALEQRVQLEQSALAEQLRMEEALKASLVEKETLLKEIHHRVKNNLQMVSSLLTLQLDQVPDEGVRELFLESVRRVRSMALIHQHLYGSATLERIDLASYVQDLSESLRFTLAPSARLVVEAAQVEVAVERAAPVCLILNELLTNAFKYGSKPRAGEAAPGQIRVEVTTDGRRARVMVRDEGPGLPSDFDLRASESLGLQLVRTLTRQLNGVIEAKSDGGAVFELSFPL